MDPVPRDTHVPKLSACVVVYRVRYVIHNVRRTLFSFTWSKAKESDQDHETTSMEVDAATTNATSSHGTQSTGASEPYPAGNKNPSRLPPSMTVEAAPHQKWELPLPIRGTRYYLWDFARVADPKIFPAAITEQVPFKEFPLDYDALLNALLYGYHQLATKQWNINDEVILLPHQLLHAMVTEVRAIAAAIPGKASSTQETASFSAMDAIPGDTSSAQGEPHPRQAQMRGKTVPRFPCNS